MKKFSLMMSFLLLCNNFIKPKTLVDGLTINPYGQTPLSAIYKLNKINNLPITVQVSHQSSSQSIAHTYPPNFGQEFALHGLYNAKTNQIKITSGTNVLLNTNVYITNVYLSQKPSKRPSRTRVHINNNVFNDPFNQDLYFMYDNYTNIVAYDKKGELRYLYQKNNSYHMLSRIENNNNELVMLFVDKKIIRVNLLGQKTVLFDKIPIHHELTYHKNNIIVPAVSYHGGVEDRIIEISPQGKIINDLYLGDMFRNSIDSKCLNQLTQTIYDKHNVKINRITGKKMNVDWAHINSLVYDNEHDILYVSTRHLGVLAIDYSHWKLKWWLASSRLNVQQGTEYGKVPQDFVYLHNIKALQKYRLKSSAEPKNQHSLLLRSNGNLLLFDNQGDNDINWAGSRILEYKIQSPSNQQGGVAQVMRNISHPKKVYSRLLSDVDLVGNNHENYLVLYGFDTPFTSFKTSRVSEFNQQGELIFDMSLGVDWVYRVEKKPLYLYQDTNKKYSIDFLEKDKL